METSNSNHNHNEVVTTIKSEVVSIKEKRKRKKFIRKVKCQVCEDVANDHIHYGATTCYSCRAFFRRSITAHAHYKCAKTNNCVINPQTRQRYFPPFPINRHIRVNLSLFDNAPNYIPTWGKQCQACRMDKCKGVGMKATWVMTEEEKQEKKEAAQARKRIKLLGGHQPNLVDSSDLPTSSYLIKRAQDRRCRKRQVTGSSSRSLEIEEDEEMSTDEIENAEDNSLSPPSSSTEVKLEPLDSPLSYLNTPFIPLLNDSSALYASWEDYIPVNNTQHSQYELNPHPDHEFGTLQASLSQRENILLKNLVNLETESREHIAMNLKTREGIMDGIKNAANIKYDVLKEGYNTAVKRIAYFMRKIEFFQNFLLEDKRALIGNNCHMVVNIKSARLLSPKNTLQTQLKVAALDTQAVIESTNNARIPRLEYNQFFQSPWCCDAGVEDQYRAMMESIFNLEMDDVCCTLLSLVAMFDTSETGEEIQAKQIYTTGIKYFDELEGLANNQIDYDRSSSPLMTPQHQITRRIVQDKSRAIEAQKFYLDLLHRYLSSQVGPQHSVILMRSYCDVLTKLKEMRQILLAKSLPF